MTPPILDLISRTGGQFSMDLPAEPQIVLIGLEQREGKSLAIANDVTTRNQIMSLAYVFGATRIAHELANARNPTIRVPIVLNTLLHRILTDRLGSPPRYIYRDSAFPSFAIVTTECHRVIRFEFYDEADGEIQICWDFRIEESLGRDLQPTWPALATEAA